MGKKKSKGFDPLGFTMENIQLGATINLGSVVMGKTNEMFPSTVSARLNRGYETLGVLPMVHGVGGVFESLRGLDKKTKKR